MKQDTKTVREVITDAGVNPDQLTMDIAGPVRVVVETVTGKSRKVTGAFFAEGTLYLRTGK
jgi:hypothetical protein